MNPIERLENLAESLEGVGRGITGYGSAEQAHRCGKELRAIISELKQRDEEYEKNILDISDAYSKWRRQRDEAVRKVADFIDVRMDAAIAKLARTSFAHTETSALANNFAAMLSDAKQDAARLRAALEGKHE